MHLGNWAGWKVSETLFAGHPARNFRELWGCSSYSSFSFWVLVFDLHSTQTIFEVALTVFRYLVDDLRVSYSSVIVFGRSLGSGPAIFLAAQYPLGGMILVSPFISIRAAARHIGGRIIAFLFSNVFQNHRRCRLEGLEGKRVGKKWALLGCLWMYLVSMIQP